MNTVIVWFRRDLRLADNPALSWAAGQGAVIPLYILRERDASALGAASRYWLNQSLLALSGELHARGSRLVLAVGEPEETFVHLARQTKASEIVWCRLYEPEAHLEEDRVQRALDDAGIRWRSFAGYLMHEPWALRTRAGGPYRVFTPFWRAWRNALAESPPLPAPDRLAVPGKWPANLPLSTFKLEPHPDWASGIRQSWRFGEGGGWQTLKQFCRKALAEYAVARDRPDCAGTSRLSPYLHWGEISPRQIWHAVRAAASPQVVEPFLRQLAWRDFAHHVLYHFPATAEQPLRREFHAFPWRYEEKTLRAWQRGLTGYPLVDAGMRELWHTGWMHNRVRMVVASFLTKDLLLDWREGERWFRDTLVDADLANNIFGWQWTAGCGADAAPFYRIFNPMEQGKRFDPDGVYVRQWLPQLQRLPARWVHFPWLAPPAVLRDAGVKLGETYPHPIVDHAAARMAALAALRQMRSAGMV